MRPQLASFLPAKIGIVKEKLPPALSAICSVLRVWLPSPNPPIHEFTNPQFPQLSTLDVLLNRTNRPVDQLTILLPAAIYSCSSRYALCPLRFAPRVPLSPPLPIPSAPLLLCILPLGALLCILESS